MIRACDRTLDAELVVQPFWRKSVTGSRSWQHPYNQGMDSRGARVCWATVAMVGVVALSACSSTSSSPGSASSSASETTAPPSDFARSVPTTVPAPSNTNGVQGLAVELSSRQATANQPVEVVVTGPASLESRSVYLVSPASADSWNVVSLPTAFDSMGRAGINVTTDKTIKLRAIVPQTDQTDSGTLSASIPLLAQSAEFAISTT